MLVSFSCNAAVRARIGASDFKTTKMTPGRETLLFAQLTNQSQLTIACWVKYEWTDAGVNSQLGAGEFQGLASKGVFLNVPSTLQFGLFSESEKLGFKFSSPAGTYHTWKTTGNSVQTNSWMHVACSFTYSNGASLKFFINGTNAIGTWTGGTGDAVGQTNATSFHTFVYEKTSTSFFGGCMSDLAIWTNTLSAGEIFKLAKSKVKYMPLQIQPATLLFYWPMDTRPAQQTVTINIDRDRSPLQSHFEMDVGGIFHGERALSYQPNE